jgi:hypothetical protein
VQFKYTSVFNADNTEMMNGFRAAEQVGQWTWDIDPKFGVPDATLMDDVDYPNFEGVDRYDSSVDRITTYVVGVACRCTENTRFFLKSLLSVGSVLARIQWFQPDKRAVITVEPGMQATDADIQNKLLKNAKWIGLLPVTIPLKPPEAWL